jgi:O-antigen/teichoic acid export membrane protein
MGSRTSTEGTVTEQPLVDEGVDGALLIKGGVSRILSFLAMIALSIGSTAVVTHHLGAVRFGEYTTAFSVASMVTVVTDAGMANLGVRQYALLAPAARGSMMSTLLSLRLTLVGIGVALSVGFAIVAGYSGVMVLGVLAVSTAAAPLVVQHTYTIPLTNELRLTTIAILELARQAVWVAGLILLSGLGGGVLTLLVVTPIAYLVMVPPSAIVCRGRVRLRPRFDLSAWRALAGPTVMFSLAAAVATVYIYTVQIVTQLVTTSYETGLFSVAFRVVVTTTTIPVLLGSSVMPILSRAARDSHAQLSYVTARFLEVSLAAGLGLALVLSAGGPFVVSVVAPGHGFHPAGSVLALQAFAMIGTFTSAPSSFALLSLGYYRRLLVSSTVALAVTVFATAFLAQSDGATGAAVAMIIGEAVTALAMLGSLAWRRPEFLPKLDRILRLAIAAIITSAVVVLLPATSVARAAAATAVYGVLLLVFRALPEEVRSTLKETMPRRGGHH